MNTLKPLLIVAVLAGIGYGVYIQLNKGNAPPPPVAEGWNTTPNVQLPGQETSAPWGTPTSGGPNAGPSGQAPAAAGPPSSGGQAPAYQAPSAAAPGGPAPPAGQAAPSGQAPPFAAAGSGNEAPPYANTNPAPPTADAQPHDPSQPHAAAGATMPPAGVPDSRPPVDPYADSHDAGTADRYQTPPADDGPPADGGLPAESAAPPAAAGGPIDFASAMEAAQRELEGGQLAAALRQLSQWYGRPELSPAEQQQLTQLLDQVAGSVVYSTQHLLEAPYEVQPGERLEDIGEKYSVPWQLLAKINGIDDPSALRPGERLKVVRGPFQAVVHLEKRELTLMTADGSYAGRFQIGIGTEHPPQEGTFRVSEKVPNPVYYGHDRAISAEDAENPLGERWIGLGNNMGIHGTNDPQNVGRTDLPGSITLSERDAEDVYDILSLGSSVTIRR